MSISTLFSSMPLIQIKAATSLRLGNVLIHPNDAQKCLALYADRLTYFANGDGWSVSQAGSTCLLQFRGRYLATSTQHQIRGCALDGVSLESCNPQTYITSNQFNSVSALPCDFGMRHVDDFCVFDFSKSVLSGSLFASRFFSLSTTSSMSRGETVVALFAIGFAYADDQLEIDESETSEFFGRLLAKRSKKRILVCDNLSVVGDGETFSMQRIGDRAVNPDGFSGGPVFAAVEEADGSFALKFAGIVISGSHSILRALSAWAIIPILSQMFPGRRT